jgi:hypothetical protein
VLIGRAARWPKLDVVGGATQAAHGVNGTLEAFSFTIWGMTVDEAIAADHRLTTVGRIAAARRGSRTLLLHNASHVVYQLISS